MKKEIHADPDLNHLTTINDDGSHHVLHPGDVRGRFTSWRRVTALILVGIYVLAPWIQINGYPAVFLDVVNRRFHLFGFTLAAQDLWLSFFLLSGTAFFLFYMTALLGRVWCGWACPQTVFLEHIYRPIERWIDGDAPKRKRMDLSPWTVEKIAKRVIKHFAFLILSAAIAHLFLSYFISLPELYEWMRTSPSEHWKAFLFVLITTGVLYLNFARFREQLCIVLCPYGRLQSVLIDDHSIVIGYDDNRGEPRGGTKSGKAGDCIDCHRCVSVCPTGIDIRQGLQMECIGCANCIDACDEIMDRMDRDRGLVRYDSLNGLAGKRTRWIRPRIIVYSIFMAVGLAVMLISLSRLDTANVFAMRMEGPPYYVDAGEVRNQFLVRLVNKTNKPVRFTVKPSADVAGFSWSGLDEPVEVEPMGEEVRPLVLLVSRGEYSGGFTSQISIENAALNFKEVKEVEFLGPDPDLLKSNEN